MSRPLKWDGPLNGLKEMTDSDIGYMVYRIVKAFAALSPGSIGTLTTASASDPIGSWVDQERNETIGTHPATGAVTTTTKTLYQELSAASSGEYNAATKPIRYSSGLREMQFSNLQDEIIRLAVSEIASGGIGSYYLSASAPSGTWVARATLIDRAQSVDITHILWQRTDAAAPSTSIRPMKWSSSLGGIQEMSNADIDSMVIMLQDEIRLNKICTYSLTSGAPLGGTWVQASSNLIDRRQQITSVGYTGAYTGAYTGIYSSEVGYVSTYTGTRGYTKAYSSEVGYVSTYTGTRGYTKAYRRNIGYISTYGGSFSGPTYYRFADFSRTYYQTSNFTGPTYFRLTDFNSTYYQTSDFTGPTYFQLTGFSGTYTGTYTGAYSGTYTGTYSGTYSGATISGSTEQVSNIKLWRRTA